MKANKTVIAYVGLEFEGVLLRGVTPVRAGEVWSASLPTSSGSDAIDTYDCLAEVRSDPLPVVLGENANDFAVRIGTQLLCEMESLEDKVPGGYKILWDEVEIPPSVHENIINDCKFNRKEIRNILTGEVYKKDPNAWASDKFRGGGMHINISLANMSSAKKVVKLLAHLPHPSGGKLPHRSRYRSPGQYCMTKYESASGFCHGIEYRSHAFSFTPLGIRHFYHTLAATLNVLNRVME